MTIQQKTIDLKHSGTNLEGMLYAPEIPHFKSDIVLVAHAWFGRDDLMLGVAHQLAQFGYIGLAIDLYGKGVLGRSVEENQALMNPFIEDREFLASRLQSWVNLAMSLYPNRAIHAVGYCFGGMCVLDMARANMGIRKAVSFHGLFHSTPKYLSETTNINTSILVLHGYNDPMVPPLQILELAQELDKRKADWILNCYGNTMHAFTNPNANWPQMGAMFNSLTRDRSFDACMKFLS